MGLMSNGILSGAMSFLFGDGRNVVVETAEVFREHAEKGAVRAADARADSLEQFAAEFIHPQRGAFDRMIDGLNRLPRPALALGTIALFVMAMVQPAAFAQGMEGLTLVPEPLWWLMGAIVSFYFGARHQAKTQDFQRQIAQGLAATQILTAPAPEKPGNAALADWQARDAK